MAKYCQDCGKELPRFASGTICRDCWLNKNAEQIIENRSITEHQVKLLKRESKESRIHLYSMVHKVFESDKELDEGEINTLSSIQKELGLSDKDIHYKEHVRLYDNVRTTKRVGEIHTDNLWFETKIDPNINEYCREFYNLIFNPQDSKLIHSKSLKDMDFWTVSLNSYFNSVAEADQSFSSVDRTLFANEMAALRLEMLEFALFALGCSKITDSTISGSSAKKSYKLDESAKKRIAFTSGVSYSVPAGFFTRSYLEEKGRLNIWHIMAEYNKAIAISAKMDDNVKLYSGSRGKIIIDSVNDLRRQLALMWVEHFLGSKENSTIPITERKNKISCIARVANHFGADVEREDGVMLRLLCARLISRLGCNLDLDPEAAHRLVMIILGFYQGAEEYLGSTNLFR